MLFCGIFAGLTYTTPADAQIVIGGGSSVADHIIDQTSKTDTTGTPYYLSPFMTGANNGHNATSIAFSFNADGEYLAYIGLVLQKVGGAGVVWNILNHPYLYISIYTDNNGTPAQWVSDSDQLSWTNIQFTTRIGEMNFTFSDLPRLIENETYWMVFNTGGNAVWHTDMYVTVYAPNTSPPANGGITLTQGGSSSWVTISPNQGICFTAYGITSQSGIIWDGTNLAGTQGSYLVYKWNLTTANVANALVQPIVGTGDVVTSIDVLLSITNLAQYNSYDYFNCDIIEFTTGANPAEGDLISSSTINALDTFTSSGTATIATFTFDDLPILNDGITYGIKIYAYRIAEIPASVTGSYSYYTTQGNNEPLISLYRIQNTTYAITQLTNQFAYMTVYGQMPLATITYTANFPLDATNAAGSAPNDHFFYAPNDIIAVQPNPGNLSASNYIFLGWAYAYNAVDPDFVVPDLTTVVPSSIIAGSSNVVLYGVWSSVVQSFATVIFRQYELEGGTINHDLDTPYLFEVGSFEFLTGAPAVNYKFMGWLQNGTMISEAQSYNFYISSEDTYVVTAIFYDPLSKGTLEDLDLMAVLAIALCAILIAFVLFAILWVRGRQQNYAEE